MQRGRRSGGVDKKELTMENLLLMTLKYLRQYVTQKELAFEFKVGEATVCDTIRRVEDALIKDGSFSLPDKKELLEDDSGALMLYNNTLYFNLKSISLSKVAPPRPSYSRSIA